MLWLYRHSRAETVFALTKMRAMAIAAVGFAVMLQQRHLIEMRHQADARVRWPTRRGSDDQRQAETLLKPLDPLRHRRRRDGQPFGGGVEGAGADNGRQGGKGGIVQH